MAQATKKPIIRGFAAPAPTQQSALLAEAYHLAASVGLEMMEAGEAAHIQEMRRQLFIVLRLFCPQMFNASGQGGSPRRPFPFRRSSSIQVRYFFMGGRRA